ncbi:hypothetical protein [Nostoc sp. DSM 114160]|jgi:arachidonate 15-lipoxygenase
MTASSPENLISSSSTHTLDIARQEYQYNYIHIPSIAMLDRLSLAEEFTTNWYFLLAQQLRVVFINTLIVNRGNQGSKSIRDDVARFILEALLKGAVPIKINILARILQIIPQFLLKGISKDVRELDDLFYSILKENGLVILRDALNRIINLLYEGQRTGHATSLKDYENLFQVIGVPAIAKTYQEDEVFAYMRVAGYNPVTIARVNTPGDRFPVTDEHYQGVMGTDDSLAAAGLEGRLYLADYKILDGAVNGTFPHEQKYLYAPLALFALPKGSDPQPFIAADSHSMRSNPRPRLSNCYP